MGLCPSRAYLPWVFQSFSHPHPQHTTKAHCLQPVTGHHTGQTFPPSKSESPLLTRDSQAPGVRERQWGGAGWLAWKTIKPIHQAEITGQLKQPARGNLYLLGLGCQLPPRAPCGGGGWYFCLSLLYRPGDPSKGLLTARQALYHRASTPAWIQVGGR